MNKVTYDFSLRNFRTFFKENPDIEELSFRGEVDFADIRNIDNELDGMTSIKRFDFSEITLTGKKGQSEKEIIDEYAIECNEGEDFTATELHCVRAMLCNLNFGRRFLIEGEQIYTSDRKVLVRSLIPIIPSNVEVIGNLCFSMTDIKAIELHTNIRYIGIGAFSFTDYLKNVSLPDSIKAMGRAAFSCSGVEQVRLPKGIKIIPDQCFSLAELEQIEIPSSVTHIGWMAFGCNYFDEIVFPEGVVAVEGCAVRSVKKVWFPSTIQEISDDFYYEDMVDIPGEDLPYIIVNEKNPYFYSKDGTLYRKGESTPYLGFAYKKTQK